MINIRLAKSDEDIKKVFEIRRVVFIVGQNVPEDRELDEHDKTATHVIAEVDGEALGCARIRFLDGYSKLERIAVLDKCRGKGYGEDIVKYLIELTKEKGLSKAKLHSQKYIEKFYEKLGFVSYGDIFMDAGIEHIAMELNLEEI